MRPATSGRLSAAALLTVALALAACGSTATEANSAPATTTQAVEPSSAPANGGEPFGAACADLPASGPGSLAEMADQPVATAAAQSPALSTLVTAVTKAGLVDTLNSASNITVFAPVNDAFAKIPKDTLNQVLADKQALTNILKYHVVGQRLAPAELDGKTPTTLQGATISTAKSGDTYTANDAKVVCGNIRTSNATVYLLDTVLMPTS